MSSYRPVRRLLQSEPCSRLGARVASAALVLVITSVLADTAVAGSCGHYLFRNGKPVSGEQHAAADYAMPSHAAMPADAQPAHDRVPGQPRRPCNGPGCHGQPLPVTPAPVSLSLSRSTDQAVLLRELLTPCTERDSSLLPQSERGECFRAASIFRPPCA